MRRWTAMFLMIAMLVPTIGTAENADGQVEAGIERVIEGMDFAAVSELTLDVPGWPEHQTFEQVVRRLAGGEHFSADDALTAVLGAFAQEVGALFQMTPYYWKTSAKGAEKLASVEKLAVEAAFDIHIYKKEN